ncbi:MAG: hypothetical protein V4596_11045 [Bdellovibrionota bacterium]
MKIYVLCALILLGISISAYADDDVQTTEDGMTLLLDAKNFDYTCALLIKDKKENIPFTLWIDDNYKKSNPEFAPQAENIRTALSWPFNETVMDSIGTVFKTTKFSQARCLTLCYEIEAEVANDDETISIKVSLKQSSSNSDQYNLKLVTKDSENNEDYVEGMCLR